jgi:peroxiredoxin
VWLSAISILCCTPTKERQPKKEPSPGVNDRGYIVKVGDHSPDFSLEFPDGATTSFEQLKGNVIMLQFTASWCSVCREEMPHIEKEIWRPYKRAGLKLIGIDRDEAAAIVTRFGKQMKISYPLSLDIGAEVFHQFAADGAGVTRNIIINPAGKIVFLTRLYDPVEFKEMIRVIHSQLEEKNNLGIKGLRNKISALQSALSSGPYNSTATYDKKRLLMKLKNELRKLDQLQSYLNRNKPD